MNEQTRQNEAQQDEIEAALAKLPRELSAKMRHLGANIQAKEQAKAAAEDTPDREPEPPKMEQRPEPDQDAAVSAALETLKAREQAQREKAKQEGRPVLSPVKRRMIESSVRIGATLPDEVTFQHSVFCQTVLGFTAHSYGNYR